MRLSALSLVAVCLLCLSAGTAFAQGKRRVVQLTGLVVSGEQALGVPGVQIIIPKAARGITTNNYGYFSLATLAGDSAVIGALGYKKQFYLVPDDGRQSISVIIYLKEDTTILPTVEIFPFATEELFKEAFLALKLPEEERNHMRQNLDEQKLARMGADMPMDGSMNHSFFMNQQVYKTENRYQPPTIQLLNPFAWARFIKSVQRGDLKKKEWEKERDRKDEK